MTTKLPLPSLDVAVVKKLPYTPKLARIGTGADTPPPGIAVAEAIRARFTGSGPGDSAPVASSHVTAACPTSLIATVGWETVPEAGDEMTGGLSSDGGDENTPPAGRTVTAICDVATPVPPGVRWMYAIARSPRALVATAVSPPWDGSTAGVRGPQVPAGPGVRVVTLGPPLTRTAASVGHHRGVRDVADRVGDLERPERPAERAVGGEHAGRRPDRIADRPADDRVAGRVDRDVRQRERAAGERRHGRGAAEARASGRRVAPTLRSRPPIRGG